MAGLWEQNTTLGSDEQPLFSFTVLTTAANKMTQGIHDRMPVFLPKEQLQAWLDPDFESIDILREMLLPAPTIGLSAFQSLRW